MSKNSSKPKQKTGREGAQRKTFQTKSGGSDAKKPTSKSKTSKEE